MNRNAWMPLVCLPTLAWLAAGQDPAVRERGQEARHVLRALAPFPEEVRNAVPVVAQFPELPGKIYDLARRNDQEYLGKLLASYPKEVQEAARLLCRTPEVLEIMAMHGPLMRIVGDLYKKQGLAPLKEIANEIRTGNDRADASTLAWSRRLQENRLALQELFEASADYAEQKPQAEYVDYGFGLAYSKRERLATVYALPAAPLTLFVLLNADRYPELADEMVEQWLHTDSDTDFDEVFRRGWEVFRQLYREDFFHPDRRPERLSAMAQLGKKVGALKKDGKATLQDRAQYLKEHAAEFPVLAKYLNLKVETLEPLKEGATVPKPKVPRKPAPTRPYTPTPEQPAPAKVVQASPSPAQQVRRGSYATNYTWYNYYQPAYYNPWYYWTYSPGYYYPGYYWSYAPSNNRPPFWWHNNRPGPVTPGLIPGTRR